MDRFAYLIGDLILCTVWGVLYIRRKDLRLEMIVMSKLSLLWIALSFTLFAPEFLTQVWKPEGIGILNLPFGILGEDVLYAFALGGIASVLYEEILKKKHLRKMRRKNNFIQIGLFPIIIFIAMFIGIRMLHINPYYASYGGFILAASIIWFFRKDLFLHSLISAAFVGFLYFVLGAFIFIPLFPHVVEKWWHVSQLSGIFVLGAPLEEVFFAASFGLFVGPAYEFLMGLRDK